MQDKYNKYKVLPVYSILQHCNIEKLNEIEISLIDLRDRLCLNIMSGGKSTYGINSPRAKYLTTDIEQAFLLLVSNPRIPHKEVADFVGIDINTVHDISACRGRCTTDMKNMHPENYAKLASMTASNTRGKSTVTLTHNNGREVTLITGGYSEFCRKEGIHSGNLSKVINGSRKTTCGWSLLEKHENTL